MSYNPYSIRNGIRNSVAAVIFFSLVSSVACGQNPQNDLALVASAKIDKADLAGARELLEEGLRKQPKNRQAFILLLDIYDRERKVDKHIELMQRLIVNFPDEEHAARADALFESGLKMIMKRSNPGDEAESISYLNKLAVFKGTFVGKSADTSAWKQSWLPLANMIVEKQASISPEETNLINTAATPILLDHLFHLRTENALFANRLIAAIKSQYIPLNEKIGAITPQEWPFVSLTLGSIVADSLAQVASSSQTTEVLILSNIATTVDWTTIKKCPLCAIKPFPQQTGMKNFSEPDGLQWERAASLFNKGEARPEIKVLADICVAKTIETNPKSPISTAKMCPELEIQLNLAEINFAKFIISDPSEVKGFLASFAASAALYNCSSLLGRSKTLSDRASEEMSNASNYRQLKTECDKLSPDTPTSTLTSLIKKLNSVHDHVSTSVLSGDITQVREQGLKNAKILVQQSAFTIIEKYFSNMDNDTVLRELWFSNSTPDPIIVANLQGFEILDITFADDFTDGTATVAISYLASGTELTGKLTVHFSQRDPTFILSDIQFN